MLLLSFLSNPWLDASAVAAIALVLALGALFTFKRYAKGHARCRRCWYILDHAATKVCPECGRDNTSVKKLAADQYRWGLPAFVLLLGLTPLAYVSFAYAHMHYTAWRWDRPGVEIYWSIETPAWWQKPGALLYPEPSAGPAEMGPVFSSPYLLVVSDVETLPDDLPATPSLLIVSLKNVRSADVSWFEQFDGCKLSSVFLDNVNLTQGRVGSGRWATHLDNVGLQNARIGPEQLAFLQHSTNLQIYRVDNDQPHAADGWYDSMPLAAMSNQVKLRYLHLTNGVMRASDFKAIADHPGASIDTLTLEQCIVDEGCFEQIGRISSLQYFFTDGIMMDARLSDVIALPLLRSLSIANSNVSPDGLKQVTSLPSLNYLDVSGCDFDASALKPLAACPVLSEIKLDESQLKLEHAAIFESFKKLKTIRVVGEPRDGEKQIVEALGALGIDVEIVPW